MTAKEIINRSVERLEEEFSFTTYGMAVGQINLAYSMKLIEYKQYTMYLERINNVYTINSQWT